MMNTRSVQKIRRLFEFRGSIWFQKNSFDVPRFVHISWLKRRFLGAEILCTLNSWQEVSIFIWTIKQFLTNANAIGFLIVDHRAWHEFRLHAVHLQFCGQNLVTRSNRYSTLFGSSLMVRRRFHCNSLLLQAVHFSIRQTKKTLYLKLCSLSTNEDIRNRKTAI